jgi:hypothetical protein
MKTAREILEKRFANVEHKKIIIYHGPQDCQKIWYEKVNPTHRAIIWGERKSSENKGQNQIKLGEMLFNMTFLVSASLMFNLYATLMGFVFPDLMVWQATFCVAIYSITGLIVIFPKGIGRILCMVDGLMVQLRSASSSVQLS